MTNVLSGSNTSALIAVIDISRVETLYYLTIIYLFNTIK